MTVPQNYSVKGNNYKTLAKMLSQCVVLYTEFNTVRTTQITKLEKINKNLSSAMPTFVALGVEDIANCCFCNLLSIHGSKSDV